MAKAAAQAKAEPVKFNFIDVNNDKELDKRIHKVARHYNSAIATTEAHIVLFGCVEHAMKHNDGSKLTNFWQLLGNNAPHRGMSAWIMTFTNLRYVTDKGGAKRWMGRDKDGKKVPIALLRIEEAKATPFYQMERADADKENPPFDPFKAVDNLIERFQRELKKGTFNNDPTKLEFARAFGENVVLLRKRVDAKVAGTTTPDKVTPPKASKGAARKGAAKGNVTEEVDFENKATG